jgi:HEPN domain-containing protein
MISSKYNNFDYGYAFSPEIATLLSRADDYLYFQNDPHAAILKTGCAVELIIKEIATRENIPFLPGDTSLQKRIWNLDDKVNLPGDIMEAMDYIRRRRNDASHESRATEYDAKECLKNAHKILCWCVERYRLGAPTEYIPPDNFYRPFGNICQENIVRR